MDLINSKLHSALVNFEARSQVASCEEKMLAQEILEAFVPHGYNDSAVPFQGTLTCREI